MPVTINVNNLSLCHKGSNGISTATVPDVCKTPAAPSPIPLPYPNIAMSSDLAKGTTTVKADGGNMCAIDGSQFARSTGDEPGSLGGVKSGVFAKEATWLTHSFDVKLEGKGACRLTDKMLHNAQNTVDMGGLLQAPLAAWPELIELCLIVCKCDDDPVSSKSGKSELKQQCVENTLKLKDSAQRKAGLGPSRLRPEVPYNMKNRPPTPLLHRVPGGTSLDPTENLAVRMSQEGLKSAKNNAGKYQVRVPDVVIPRSIDMTAAGAAASLTAPSIEAVVEIKFDELRDPYQISDYEKIAGDPNRVVELNPEECKCKKRDRKKALQEEYEKAKQHATRPAPQSVIPRVPDNVPAPTGIFDRKTWETITGLSGVALTLYLIVSEGSRLFPPRNLVPIP
jgi:hypothetical protein